MRMRLKTTCVFWKSICFYRLNQKSCCPRWWNYPSLWRKHMKKSNNWRRRFLYSRQSWFPMKATKAMKTENVKDDDCVEDDEDWVKQCCVFQCSSFFLHRFLIFYSCPFFSWCLVRPLPRFRSHRCGALHCPPVSQHLWTVGDTQPDGVELWSDCERISLFGWTCGNELKVHL